MTRDFMANLVLARLRQRGVAFGGPPTNATADLDPPAEVLGAIALGYTQLLDDIQDARCATLDVDFLTVAGASRISIQPLPDGQALAGGTLHRPAMTRIYELRYVYGGAVLAQERRIPYASTARFRALSGQYTQRYGARAAFPYAWTQMFGMPYIEVYPAFATTGDTIKVYGTPDPAGTEAAYPGIVPATFGGGLTNGTDEPIVQPRSLHMGIVHYATWLLAAQADKKQLRDDEMMAYMAIVESANEHGSARGEGDSDQQVEDPWGDPMGLS